jgi:hypothetical protein
LSRCDNPRRVQRRNLFGLRPSRAQQPIATPFAWNFDDTLARRTLLWSKPFGPKK